MRIHLALQQARMAIGLGGFGLKPEVAPMENLDLRTRPPRSPKVELDGLVMLARTIDKLRASLPGGNVGVYKIDGFSQRMLDAIGVSEKELRDVVADAKDDSDVVGWLRSRIDWAKAVEVSNRIRGRNLNDVDREDFSERYPVVKTKPELHYLVDVLEADDAEMFSKT